MERVIETSDAPAAIGPYSQAMQFNGMIITSGQLPIDPETGDMPEDAKSQARQSLENVKAILEAAGSSMSKVRKTTIFIKDMNDFTDINEVYKQYFTLPFPARSCVEVARLPKDAKVEIEVIATC
ncbi:RidA family protein [Sansalvadorimonas sp. 2012CJ34-2]|uniref:RidA family protein n=1 Tax=Parendozoicomonas callyspongiae TaxID=2942213 RepID=A0ABT0PGS2_9GAMM|nr:RidA family protein [Sansalvadorimonas sp. 2012CJ34-2]MCL6270582.1 RidA family protein [Sansalvadorimonas sp. 2012CJ34-2]